MTRTFVSSLLSQRDFDTFSAEIEHKITRLFSSRSSYVPQSCRKQAIIQDLWEYVISNPRYRKYSPSDHSLEIMESCLEALHYFDPQRGDFLSYFNVIVSRNLRKAAGKTGYETTHHTSGMSARKTQVISRAIRRFEMQGIAVTADMIIEAANMEHVYLDEYDVRIYSSSDINMDAPVSDSSDASVSDFIADTSPSPELLIENEASAEELFDKIGDAFIRLDNIQREYIRDAVTARLCSCLDDVLAENENLKWLLYDSSWFSDDIYEYYRDTGVVPEQREIADMHGIHPVSLSRALGKFISSIR